MYLSMQQLKKREQKLIEAHNDTGEQIKELLSFRLKIAGAIEENKLMQVMVAKNDTNT